MSTDDSEQRIADIVSEESVSSSRSQRYRRMLDESVITPLRIIWGDWRTRLGSLLLIGIVLMGTVGVRLTDEPAWNDGPAYIGPFDPSYTRHWFGLSDFTVPVVDWTYTGIWTYPLGTDGRGQPILEALVHQTPNMLKMMIAGAVFAMAVGAIIGTAAGYLGGRTDGALMFLTDIFLTVPGLPLIIVIVSFYTPGSPYLVGFLLAVDNWPGLSRTLRSQVLSIRNESYVEASQAMGLSSSRVLRKDIISQLMPYITINAATAARGIIFEAVGLYFLGILPVSKGNWGVMMNNAYNTDGVLSQLDRVHWLLIPMFMIFLLSVALILLSQGMDRLFNPRIRARHADTDEAPESME